jgi:hypothetical protein
VTSRTPRRGTPDAAGLTCGIDWDGAIVAGPGGVASTADAVAGLELLSDGPRADADPLKVGVELLALMSSLGVSHRHQLAARIRGHERPKGQA